MYQTNDYTLTATFKDAQGNELKATEVDAQKYHIHDTYTSKAAVIPGYTLEKHQRTKQVLLMQVIFK